MCATCGCSGLVHQEESEPPHPPGHHHHREARTIHLERDLLAENDRLARANREAFAARKLFVVNLMSSPGSGKTTLLERTVRTLAGTPPVSVIEGDQATERDAERIRSAGAKAVQVNTGAGCHLDAHMVAHALEDLDPPQGSFLAIENVGNLVCPALFDLGEQERVVVTSVTEGEDKPLKYPHMFRAATCLVVNKIDLAPHVGFDRERFLGFAREVNPRLEILELSARSGEGMESWSRWIRERGGAR